MTPISTGVSACIPTFRRERVLLDTLDSLMRCDPPAVEILVIDQTPRHEHGTERALQAWHDAGAIRWLRLAEPSIPAAMNAGLLAATQARVLFLDDDIIARTGLVGAHEAAGRRHPGSLVAGRVLQPWDPDEAPPTTGFSFAGTTPHSIREFMGGNFSLPRERALRLGGFDENFVKVAYRFEAEFAHRWLAAGGTIQFEPQACLRHLKAVEGGTRTFGEHLTTWRPDHAVGAYYWSLRTRHWSEFLRRPLRAVATRFHLRHPWRIPLTLWAELAGMAWAMRLHLGGPRYVRQDAHP